MPNGWNRKKLIAKMAEEAGITKTQANRAFNSVIDGVTTALIKGQRVTITGFGTFSVISRKARTGRNPKTGASLKIASRKVPRFTPGRNLKQQF